MSRRRNRSVAQRLGLLSGGGLILGGVLGWAWSLLQAPKPEEPPMAVPQTLSAPTPAAAGRNASGASSLEVVVEPGERALVLHEPLDASSTFRPEATEGQSADVDDPLGGSAAGVPGETSPQPVTAATQASAAPIRTTPPATGSAEAAQRGPEVAPDIVQAPTISEMPTISEAPVVADAAPSAQPAGSGAAPVGRTVPEAVKAIRAAAAAARERLEAPGTTSAEPPTVADAEPAT